MLPQSYLAIYLITRIYKKTWLNVLICYHTNPKIRKNVLLCFLYDAD